MLLADDDPELIALVDATLRHDGFACCAATNGMAALRLAREVMPDLMVLDVKMPKLDGFDVLESVRRDPAIQILPVILMTACDEPADIVRASELRADDYLAKPVSPSVLLNRVQRLLASHPATARWTRALPGGTASRGGAVKQWTLNGNACRLVGPHDSPIADYPGPGSRAGRGGETGSQRYA